MERKLRIVNEENADEFIIEVLEKYEVVEVDLIEKSTSKYENFDEGILADLAKVKPDLGQGGQSSKLPIDVLKAANRSEVQIKRALSEMISPNRTLDYYTFTILRKNFAYNLLPDAREDGCKDITYDTNLPDASVVIIFNEEENYSLLIRNIHSLINRTPAHLLQEIILVDDYSTNNKDLKGKLERYLATRFPKGKIRLFRLQQKAGLIRAKMIGAHFAIGDVLAFLYGHCEVTEHWLPPLLQRIKENSKTLVIPIVDDIDPITFEYHYTKDLFYIGGFSWDGQFTHYKIPIHDHEAQRKQFHYSPTLTPTIAGGLFAIDRRYFWKIGSYDPDMDIRGGENLEISFRIWQCGGSVERIPCSRVGRVSTNLRTKDWKPFEINSARLSEVWMDEYKELFYLSTPNLKGYGGSIGARAEFRKRMNCKSFQWYLENIYPEKFKLFFDSKYYGQIRNEATNYCLDNMQHAGDLVEYRLAAYGCSMKLDMSQTYYLSYPNPNKRETESYLLRREYEVAKGSDSSSEIKMVQIENARNETWKIKDHQIIHEKTSKCLSINMDSKNIELMNCNSSSPNQKWIINNFGKNEKYELK